jgi:hypothetical protein
MMEERVTEEPQFRKSGGKAELYSEIIIRAPPERIWEILTDFAAYPAWNPFIPSIRGELMAGGQITASLRPPGASEMTIRPVLITVDPPREIRWRGHLFFSGIFDGEHDFEIHPAGTGRCLFVQREYFSGILLPLLQRMLRINTARGFAQMNKALKERAEKPRP